MSSFFKEYGTYVFVALIIAGLGWRSYFRHWHVGFGGKLFLRASDGTVWVGSRLLNSPAHKAGIGNQDRVLSINGVEMQFSSYRRYREWFQHHRPKRGKKQTWVVEGREGIITAVMEPARITTKIPLYGDPNVRVRGEGLLSQDPRIKRGLLYCSKTGQYIPTASVSNQAIFETYSS